MQSSVSHAMVRAPLHVLPRVPVGGSSIGPLLVRQSAVFSPASSSLVASASLPSIRGMASKARKKKAKIVASKSQTEPQESKPTKARYTNMVWNLTRARPEVATSVAEQQALDLAVDPVSLSDRGAQASNEQDEDVVIFEPGSVVECSMGSELILGVVLDTVIYNKRLRLRLLGINGIIHFPYVESVLFMAPSYAVPSVVCEAAGEHDTTAFPQQTQARASIISVLREVTRDLDTGRNEVDELLEGAWEHFRSRDSGRRGRASTQTVTDWVIDTKFGKGKGKMSDKAKDMMTFAVHRYLLMHPSRFEAASRPQWKGGIWRVWSEDEARALDTVVEWMRESHPAIGGFEEKCRILINHAKSQVNPQAILQPPSLVFDADSSLLTFSPEDKIIISVIQRSLHHNRNQASPFSSTVCTIIKRIGQHGDILDSAAVRSFLCDIGVRTPWDDFAALASPVDLAHREADLHSASAWLASRAPPRPPISDDQFTAQTPAHPVIFLSTYNHLSPDEFYPSDPVAHLRHDFGNLPIYVIDDPEALELDDGVSIEKSDKEDHVWIHAHIADPTAVLHPTHRISQFAAERSETSYLSQGASPLLPDALTVKRFSLGMSGGLQPGQAQECLTFSAEIDTMTGEMTNYKVRPALIRNLRITSYANVNATFSAARKSKDFKESSVPLNPVLESKPSTLQEMPRPPATTLDGSWFKDLKLLHDTSLVVLERRFSSRGFNICYPKSTVKIKPKPLPVLPSELSAPVFSRGSPSLSLHLQPSSTRDDPATELVSTAMTLAGSVAAKFLSSRFLPAPYRTSPSPLASSTKAVKRLLEARNRYTGAIDPFAAAREGLVFLSGQLAFEPGSHWMMGLPASEGGYVRVTSPLRRYSDLLAHWQIKHALLAEAALEEPTTEELTLLPRAEMQALASLAEAGAKDIKLLQTQSEAFWKVNTLNQAAVNAQPTVEPASDAHTFSSPTSTSGSVSSAIDEARVDRALAEFLRKQGLRAVPRARRPFESSSSSSAFLPTVYDAIVLERSIPCPTNTTESVLSVFISALAIRAQAFHPTQDTSTGQPVIYEAGSKLQIVLDRFVVGVVSRSEGLIVEMIDGAKEEGERGHKEEAGAEAVSVEA